MRAPYRLVKRQNSAGKLYFQVRFLAEDGSILTTKSYHQAKTLAQAVRLAEEELKKGIISAATNPLALPYMRLFWTREGEYTRGRALRGRKLSEKYLQSGTSGLKKFAPFLEGLTMQQLTPRLLEKAILALAESGLGPRSINLGLEAVLRPYAVFCRGHRIADGLSGVEKVKEHPKERGVLSMEEMAWIIALPPEQDPRARLAILLGALCGLRKGEVRGLMLSDVDFAKGTLNVCHNIVMNKEGIKLPKAGSARMVPAPDCVLEAIRYVRGLYPGSPFVVPHLVTPSVPCPCLTIDRGFLRVLKGLGISPAEKKSRNLVFHGLRHFFVSLSRSSGIPDYLVMRLAGHKSASMMENYSHIGNVLDFADAKKRMDRALDPQVSSKG